MREALLYSEKAHTLSSPNTVQFTNHLQNITDRSLHNKIITI